MTIDVTYTIKVGKAVTDGTGPGLDQRINFTNRCTGFECDQRLAWMSPTTQSATITLNNFDGALTPRAGGGTGQWATLDWFSQGLYIEFTIVGPTKTVTGAVFHGVIDRFDLFDDGTESYVTIEAVDIISWLGRLPRSWELPVSAGTLSGTVSSILDISDTYGKTVQLVPLLDRNEAIIDLVLITRTETIASPSVPAYDEITLARTAIDENQTVADALRTQVMSSGMTAIYSTRISGEGSTTRTHYTVDMVDPNLVRRTRTESFGYVNVYPIYLCDGNPVSKHTVGGAGEYTFSELEVGYNTETLINTAEITSVVTTNTTTVINGTSADLYGAQTFSATETPIETDAMVEINGNNLVNRFGNINFGPKRVKLTTAGIRTNPDNDSWNGFWNVLEVNGLYNLCYLRYTPTGATSEQNLVMITFGRTIRATPENTEIVIELLPAEDFQTFVLNSDAVGRLAGFTAYDSPVVQYDDGGFPYQGETLPGNRLL